LTTIHDITLQAPSFYDYGDYNVGLVAKVSSNDVRNQIRELFSKCVQGTSVVIVPGQRPRGFDHTEDSVNTVYITFTHGVKARSGYYLLIGFTERENPTPEGLEYVIDMALFYLGTLAVLQEGVYCKELGRATNDWNI